MAPRPGNGGVLERARRALTGVALALAGCGGDGAGTHAFPIPGDHGRAILVEVLNTTAVGGLARGGTGVLRRAGFDVVYFGNAPAEIGRLDTTRIVVRRGDREAGERVRRALGRGVVVVQRDSARLLDVSVLLGTDVAPRGDFHP